jgi:hypothetical protein
MSTIFVPRQVTNVAGNANIAVLGLEAISCFFQINDSTCIALLTLNGLRVRSSRVFCSLASVCVSLNHLGIANRSPQTLQASLKTLHANCD